MNDAEARSAARRSLGFLATLLLTAVAAWAVQAFILGGFNSVSAYLAIGLASLVWTFMVDKPKGQSAVFAVILFGPAWPLAALLAAVLVISNLGRLTRRA